jgi:hypothetical protein
MIIILPFPLHNRNLFRREAIELIDHFVDFTLKGGCVGILIFPSIKRGLRGVLLLGSEDLVNKGDKGLLCFWFSNRYV